MTLKERIKSYLSAGLKPSQVASIVGCTPAYLSQLLKDEGFKAEVEAARNDDPPPEEERLDKKYQSAEHRIVDKIMDAVEDADLGQLTRALDSVVKAQDMKHARKNPATNPGALVNVNLVSLTLPAHAFQQSHPTVVLNEQHEVIAIDNKPMAPMSSDGVRNLFAQIQEKKKAAATPVPIPSDF